MASKSGWSRRFDDPITLPRGRQILTLKDAADYVMKLPKAEQDLEVWQTAARELMIAAERNGIMMLAEIAMKLAIHRNDERVFNPNRKDHHWGKRKLKRDQ